MKNNSFEKGALILVLTGLISKALGALYRIPLTNIIGIEGIGMYQMIIPTLLLMLALTSNYMPITISKCVAYLTVDGDKKEPAKIFNSAIKIVLIITILLSFILILLSKNIAIMQQEYNLYVCYILLVPTIIISGIKNVYRGWFLGYKEMIYPSISQLIEQIAKIAAGLSFAYIGIMQNNTAKAVYGATFGLIIGEVASYLFLCIARYIKRPIKIQEKYNKIAYFKLIIQESTPVMLSSIVFPIVSFIDSFLIVNLLIRFGLKSSQAISQYGLLQGPVHSLIHLPIMVATSISLAIIPMLSSLQAKYNTKDIKQKSSMSIKMCLYMVIPAAIGLVIIAKPILEILYPKISAENIDFCAKLMACSSINIVFLSLLEIFTSIHQGLNQSGFAAKVIAISTLFKIAVEMITIKYLGIFGAIISNILMYVIVVVVLSYRYEKMVGKDTCLIQNIGKIVISSGIMALIIIAIVSRIYNNAIIISASIGIGIVSYIVMTIILSVFNEDELRAIPLGKYILKLRRGKGDDKSNRAWK